MTYNNLSILVPKVKSALPAIKETQGGHICDEDLAKPQPSEVPSKFFSNSVIESPLILAAHDKMPANQPISGAFLRKV